MIRPAFDIVQIGYGPGGQALGALMGRMGHRVLVFERYPSLYNLPRAGHIDHEVVRVVQQVGDAQRLVDTMWEVRDDYVWLNGEGKQIMLQPLQAGTTASGWYADYTMYQPNLEDALHAAAIDAGVAVEFGWDVVALRQDENGVEVTVNRVTYNDEGERVRSEEYQVARARYAVAADGASSFVRTALGIPRDDLGFNERWLDVDMRTIAPHTFTPNIGQICDPERPRMLMPLGKTHRRFEWQLHADETNEQMERAEVAWELLREYGVTQATHEISRQIVYAFQSRIATRWRVGRVFLAGDAAHTMPPYAGQGVCSAIRDANNLAWKLHLALAGLAGDTLLDTYEAERRPHALAWTRISIAEGEISVVTDAVLAAERDARLLAGGPLPIPEFPTLQDGLLLRDEHGAPILPAGTLGVQGRVRSGEREGLLDDLLGSSRFQLIVRGALGQTLNGEQRWFLDSLNAIIVELGVTVDDIDGRLTGYLDDHGVAAVLHRPDFYVFGAVADLAQLGSLVDALRTGLAIG